MDPAYNEFGYYENQTVSHKTTPLIDINIK